VTITSIVFIAAAQPGRDLDLLAQGGTRRASYGLAWFLAAALVVAPLAAALLADENIPRQTQTSPEGAQPVLTDSPPPAYVLRLERDPFR
jgi:hypothetical protein